MNENSVQFTVTPIKIENVVDVIPTIEYAVVPKAEPQIIDDEIVPEQFIPTSSLYLEDYIRPQELLVCRACLLSDCRLYSMRGHNLEDIYRCLTNSPSLHNDNIPLLLCAKCACFLDKCQQFRQKTNIAQERLNFLVFPVTYKQIKETYDKVNIHFSSLTVRQMPPDHYDYCVSEGFTDGTTLNIKPEIKSDDDEQNDEKPPVEDVDDDDDTDYDEPLANVSKSLKVQENDEEAKLKMHNPENKSTNVKKYKRKPRHEMRISYKRLMLKNVFKRLSYTLEEQLVELQKRKEHIKYKFYKHKCDICYMAYNHEDTYKKHMAQHSKDFGNFVCEVCNLRFKSRAALVPHIATHTWHYCCVYCSFETNVRDSAIRHLYQHKDKLSQLECNEDVPSKAEGCSDKTEPKKKKQVPNVFVICEICGKYLQIGGLKGHMDEHEGKTFKCEECGKEYNNSYKYQKHIKVYHSGLNHDCPHCGKQYKAEKSKNRHISLVHQPGAFECKMCSKVFRSLDYLKRHEEYVHYKTKTYKRYDPENRKKKVIVREKPKPDPAKPFVCEHCYKGFKNIPYLKQHLKFVHEKKPRSMKWKTKLKTKETTSKDTDVK